MLFVERLSVFFITLFLRRRNAKFKKPHCHSRFPKPNLKILLINWIILEKLFKFQIFCTESNMMLKWYLPKSEAAVHRFYSPLQKNAYSWVSFLLTLWTYSVKNKTAREVVFLWVCLIFKITFFCETWLLLLNAIHFLCCADFMSKMVFSTTLPLFWLSSNISRENTVSCVLTAVSGSHRKLVDLLLIKQVIHPKCSIRSSRPAVFFKNYVL